MDWFLYNMAFIMKELRLWQFKVLISEDFITAKITFLEDSKILIFEFKSFHSIIVDGKEQFSK